MTETPKFGGAVNDKTPSGSCSAKSRVELVSAGKCGIQPKCSAAFPRSC